MIEQGTDYQVTDIVEQIIFDDKRIPVQGNKVYFTVYKLGKTYSIDSVNDDPVSIHQKIREKVANLYSIHGIVISDGSD